jgi:hypothetical protein
MKKEVENKTGFFKKYNILLIVFLLIFLISFAYPVSFYSPTPVNNAIQSAGNVEINVSITEDELGEVIYNWNGTNFTLYDDSLVLMMNFDNVSALGECYDNETEILTKEG